MVRTWCSYNLVTHEYSEAIEPIHFKQFLFESGLENELCKNVVIADSREDLESLLTIK